ncbi:hypothetical protein ACJJIC_14170 [Microbulbifer sp. ANSA002]|uniref:hypothetical protein n=1 Tax=unclassified Microbulbifer TaxID=2619833 RepID=UPI0040420F1A
MKQLDYQLNLSINEIELTKPTVKRLQTNAICKRSHKTILQGLQQPSLRRMFYGLIKDLKKDLGKWLVYYDNDRIDLGEKIWKEKLVN